MMPGEGFPSEDEEEQPWPTGPQMEPPDLF
jgi:hypothetical protein